MSIKTTKLIESEIASLYRRGHLTKHSTGVTYIVQIAGEHASGVPVVKIGYSVNILRRIKNLACENNELRIVAILEGGRTLEAYLHHMFEALRLPGAGERFLFSEPLRGFAAIYMVPARYAECLSGIQGVSLYVTD